MDDLLTCSEAAAMLKLTRTALYAATARRQVPVIRFGKRLRYRRRELEKLLDRGAQPALEVPSPDGRRWGAA